MLSPEVELLSFENAAPFLSGVPLPIFKSDHHWLAHCITHNLVSQFLEMAHFKCEFLYCGLLYSSELPLVKTQQIQHKFKVLKL